MGAFHLIQAFTFRATCGARLDTDLDRVTGVACRLLLQCGVTKHLRHGVQLSIRFVGFGFLFRDIRGIVASEKILFFSGNDFELTGIRRIGYLVDVVGSVELVHRHLVCLIRSVERHIVD